MKLLELLYSIPTMIITPKLINSLGLENLLLN